MTPYYDDGQCVIYHGDCRDILPHVAADVLVTDPPYGIALRSNRGGQFGASRIAGDETTEARDWVLDWWGGRPAIVFGSWRIPRPAGTRMLLVWEKGDHVGMGDLELPWKPNTEEVYVLGAGFIGHRGGSALRHLARAGIVAKGRDRVHPTEKPLGLMVDLLSKCPPGVVLDPFMGSGTTLRAAKDVRRKAIGIELDERYCEIAARRLSQEVLPLEDPA